MRILIKLATWGNAASVTDITSTLQKKADAGYLNLIVGPELAGVISFNNTMIKPQETKNYEITGDESEKIRSEASKKCPDGNKSCIDNEIATQQQALIQKKIKKSKDEGNNPLDNGDRLNLTYKIDDDPESTIVLKTGEKLQINAPVDVEPTKTKEKFGNMEDIQNSLTGWAEWIIATIFSLAVAYIAYDRVKQINFLTMFPIPPNLAILIKILPYITFILVYLVSTYTKIFFLCMYIAYQLLMKCS
jgi:hypothetical protein